MDSEADKAMLDVLVEVWGGNGPVRKALEWFEWKSISALQSQMCNMDVTTTQGQAAYYILKGRTIGVADALRTAKEEMERRVTNNANIQVKTVIDAATGY